MTSHLFLSHDHRDAELAHAIADTLGRITLYQLEVWYSSDSSARGGLEPGSIWLDQIRLRLSQSRAVVALISPWSVSRPWLSFEAGFGEASSDCEVIPLCVGLSENEVPFPLAMYQCFQLSDYDSLKRFVSKLVAKFEINFDEEMAEPVLRTAISAIARLGSGRDAQEPAKELTLATLQDSIIEHIDRKFVQVADRQGRGTQPPAGERPADSYTVPVRIAFPELESTQYLEIDSSTTLSRAMDKIYFMLGDEVPAYTYLETWILRERNRSVNLVVREVQSMIRACEVFTAESEWEAVPLSSPYTASDTVHPHAR